MSFERHELSPQEIEEALPQPSQEILDIKSDLQRQLVMRSHDGKEDLGDHFQNWIKKNSLKFRIIFNDLRYNNPNLINQYKDDDQKLLSIIIEKMESLPDFDEERDPFRQAA